jgi:uncharacterized protein YabE (DUF348 family)
VPGQTDVWNHVTPAHILRRVLENARAALRPSTSTAAAPGSHPDAVPGSPSAAAPSSADQSAQQPVNHRRALRLGALAAVAVVLAGGSFATASAAHKTVTLDIDGRLTHVSTFAGSVSGLLDEKGVDVGSRDRVAPASTDSLRDGDEIVVRHAHPVVVEAAGVQKTVWTTALSADDALADLSARGEQVRLLPSRSQAGGRADLSVRLDLDGPVDVVADGRTQALTDGAVTLDRALSAAGVTLGQLDRVRIERPDTGRLTVVVQRVVSQEQTAVVEVPFQTVTEKSDTLYTGQSRTAVAGVTGEQTSVFRVILVDGVEESRMLISDAVTRQPVAQVVREGTKARPVAAPRAPASTSTSASAAVVTGDVWGALAKCESGGNPTAVSSNGLYYGLYQFSVGTWQAMGGAGLPSQASPAEQTQRAQALQARSGWGQWPACAAKLGLL